MIDQKMAYDSICCLLIVLLLPFSAIAQSQGNIIPGASLSAAKNASSASWISPSGDFAFGFLEKGKNLFLLCIWYDKIPDKTTVWYADDGRLVEPGSKVQLTADKGLVLSSPRGEELWKSQPVNGTVASAHLNDTGNFFVKDRNSRTLWETFDTPTDTILPLQTIGKGGSLNSRKTETEFSPGRFRLALLDNGNLVLSSLALPSKHLNQPYYYKTETQNDTDPSNSGINLVFNQSGYLYVLRENSQKSFLSDRLPDEKVYYRVTLNFDGVLTQYGYPKGSSGNGQWSALWSQPGNICVNVRLDTGTGACGYNSICTLDTNQRPTCKCPSGYSLLDPNDTYGSCKPDFALGCEHGTQSLEDQYDMEEVHNTDWPLSDYEMLQPFSMDDCKDACLKDCMCAVSISRDNTCWKKKLPLSNGRLDREDQSIAFVKVGKVNSSLLSPCTPPNLDRKKDEDCSGFIVAGSVALGMSGLVNLVLLLAFCLGFFSVVKKKNVGTSKVEGNLRCFSYKELVEATGGFKEELGKGAFGIVYKGKMKTSCGDFVAVKKLDRMVHEGEKEFKAEVDVIGQTHHKNLVRLFGFCNEGSNRLLVYEYMSKGTLSRLIFENERPGWNQRIEIILGIARGLVYLHEECSTQIIHCDIKPQNILLDEFNNARISDFGLAKLLNIGQSYTNTGIRGTKGYVAPEWFRNQPITVKVDVYSFGVLLLEIVCCRRNVDQEQWGYENGGVILTDRVYDCYVEGALEELMDDDVEALGDWKRMERFLMVGLWCIQEDMQLRPSMRKVVQMLEGVVEVGDPPCPSPYP